MILSLRLRFHDNRSCFDKSWIKVLEPLFSTSGFPRCRSSKRIFLFSISCPIDYYLNKFCDGRKINVPWNTETASFTFVANFIHPSRFLRHIFRIFHKIAFKGMKVSVTLVEFISQCTSSFFLFFLKSWRLVLPPRGSNLLATTLLKTWDWVKLVSHH